MKRLLVAMLSVVLVIGMLPGMAFAQETPVAQNTSTGATYTDLSAAVSDEDAAGSTIELLADIDLEANNVVITKNMTLDLAGHTVTSCDLPATYNYHC